MEVLTIPANDMMMGARVSWLSTRLCMEGSGETLTIFQKTRGAITVILSLLGIRRILFPRYSATQQIIFSITTIFLLLTVILSISAQPRRR